MTLVQPTVEMQQHIRSELNEDVSTREKDLEHINEWLRLQPHLPQFQGKKFVMTHDQTSPETIFHVQAVSRLAVKFADVSYTSFILNDSLLLCQIHSYRP